MKKTLWLAAVAAVALLNVQGAEAQTGRTRNRIERVEIEAAHSTSVYDLVRNRRPAWLNRQHASSLGNQSPELMVFVNGAKLDGVSELRQVSAADVEIVEFLNAGQAEFRFGQTSPNGAIAVTLRGAAPAAPPSNTQG